MQEWIGDIAIAHLRDVAEWPDVGDRYEVIGRLGRGGMGVVYAAHDRLLGRDVAIKVVDGVHERADASRLLGEAKILAQLEHPGIVPVHDAGVLPDGRAYYVMKRVRGERLDAAISRRSLTERLDLFLRISDSVAFAHSRGIVHRDLKPANIMLGQFGEVLVIDWGIALAQTQACGAGGTPGYMAPEQRLGSAEVDQRADVYALGVILEALTTAPAPKPLAAIARRAQASRPGERYPSVPHLIREVMRFRDGESVDAYQETVVERMARLYKRYQLPILLVLAYVIMRLVLLAGRGA